MTLPMRRRLQLSPIVFGVLLLAGCSTNGSPSSSAPSAVNIGLPAAFTGGTVQYGEPWFQGAQVAADYINSNGGIMGAQLNLIPVDTGGDPVDAVPAVRRMLALDNISMSLGLSGLDWTELAVNHQRRPHGELLPHWEPGDRPSHVQIQLRDGFVGCLDGKRDGALRLHQGLSQDRLGIRRVGRCPDTCPEHHEGGSSSRPHRCGQPCDSPGRAVVRSRSLADHAGTSGRDLDFSCSPASRVRSSKSS